MLSRNISYKNFHNNLNKKKYNKLQKFLEHKNLLKNYPLLSSLKLNYKNSFNNKDINKLKNFAEFNLIGMGGSILGSQTIYDFLYHKVKKKFYFFNNLQNYKNLKSKKKRLNIIVSKSGNTLETFSNLNLILSNQKKNKNLIISENKKSIINNLADDLKAKIVEHKNFIGGRYSVFSEVGMLPAELMGMNSKKFKRFNDLINQKKFKKILIKNVLAIYNFISKGKNNSVILNYDEKSNNLFKWYQQLIAESLGKNGKGLFPIISTMPKDNHSLLQLYLDGPKNNFFTFFNVLDTKTNRFDHSFLKDEFKILKKKNINDVLCAQKKATEIVFRKKNIPFRSFEIINRSEETLGELFTFFVLETLMLGKLLKVDPLNQPSVELIKIETKKILK